MYLKTQCEFGLEMEAKEEKENKKKPKEDLVGHDCHSQPLGLTKVD